MARPLLIVGPLADLLLKAAVQLGLFDEAKHPRQGKGSAKGGQFAPKGQRTAPAPAPAPEPTRDDTRSVEDYLEEARLSTASGGEGGPETRQEMQDILKEQQEGIASQIRMEVAQLQPIARVSDTALVFGVRPRNGILFSTPAGTCTPLLLPFMAEPQLWPQKPMVRLRPVMTSPRSSSILPVSG